MELYITKIINTLSEYISVEIEHIVVQRILSNIDKQYWRYSKHSLHTNAWENIREEEKEIKLYPTGGLFVWGTYINKVWSELRGVIGIHEVAVHIWLRSLRVSVQSIWSKYISLQFTSYTRRTQIPIDLRFIIQTLHRLIKYLILLYIHIYTQQYIQVHHSHIYLTVTLTDILSELTRLAKLHTYFQAFLSTLCAPHHSLIRVITEYTGRKSKNKYVERIPYFPLLTQKWKQKTKRGMGVMGVMGVMGHNVGVKMPFHYNNTGRMGGDHRGRGV